MIKFPFTNLLTNIGLKSERGCIPPTPGLKARVIHCFVSSLLSAVKPNSCIQLSCILNSCINCQHRLMSSGQLKWRGDPVSIDLKALRAKNP